MPKGIACRGVVGEVKLFVGSPPGIEHSLVGFLGHLAVERKPCFVSAIDREAAGIPINFDQGAGSIKRDEFGLHRLIRPKSPNPAVRRALMKSMLVKGMKRLKLPR